MGLLLFETGNLAFALPNVMVAFKNHGAASL